MAFTQRQKAILLLEDGTAFYGHSCGKPGTTSGEICFNTGMTGYQEIYTDPSYYGQILINTFVHIGNYGVHPDETESAHIHIAGLVCRNFSSHYSRQKADASLKNYFEENGLVAICDVDTRALVRHIRSKGAMNAIISSEITDPAVLQQQFANIPSMKGLELSSRVSTTSAYEVGDPSSSLRVAVLDLGIKQNIIRCMVERGAYCKVFPLDTSYAEMEQWEPDGYLISNGPGDPESMTNVIGNLKDIINSGKPVFGICLGHQLISWAMGIPTYKMFNGHRGVNHPIMNIITGKGEITSQNHGFVSDREAIQGNVEITHYHLNDNSVAGIRIKDKPVFSVQYHPEASAGPHDSRYLFDDFISQLEKAKNSVLSAAQ